MNVVTQPRRKHVVSTSGGIGSWAAGKRVAEQHGTRNLELLFADTYIEDEDLYRFLIEAAANIFDVPCPRELVQRAAQMPELESFSGEPMRERIALLTQLADDTMEAIPGLCWIADGRTPWQVFHDVGVLGNTRIDPCSRIPKRELLHKWTTRYCDPEHTTVYIGIDWTEEHRYTHTRAIQAERGWTYEAPMCEAPHVTKQQMLQWLTDELIQAPRLYDDGFPHNNCGGFCVKAGHKTFKVLLKTRRKRFLAHEAEEQAFMCLHSHDHTILRDRRGGKTTPLSLREFRERVERDEPIDEFDYGGCGCALASPDEAMGDRWGGL